MAVRPTYNKTKGSLVSMGASEQGLDYKLKGYSSYVDSLDTKLASMQKYSQKKAEDEATEEGINEALETNRDTDAFLAADDKTKKEMVGEDKWFKSKKEVAYTETMYALTTNDIMTKAQTDINNLDVRAALEGMPSTDYYKNLVIIKNNYSTSFNDIDAATALKLNENFMQQIPKLYAAYATKESAKLLKVRQANASELGNNFIKQIPNLIKGHLRVSTPETLLPYLNEEKRKKRLGLAVEGLDTSAFSTAFDKEVIASLADIFSPGKTVHESVKDSRNFRNGQFDDPTLQKVFDKLSAVDKDLIEKILDKDTKRVIDEIKDEEKISEGKALEQQEEYEEKFDYYFAKGNLIEIKKIINEMKDRNYHVGAAGYELLINKDANRNVLMAGDYGKRIADIEKDIDDGVVNREMLQEMFLNDRLMKKDYDKLVKNTKTFEKENAKEAKDMINLKFSFDEQVGYSSFIDDRLKAERGEMIAELRVLIEKNEELRNSDDLKEQRKAMTPVEIAKMLLAGRDKVKEKTKAIDKSIDAINQHAPDVFHLGSIAIEEAVKLGVFKELNEKEYKNAEIRKVKLEEALKQKETLDNLKNFINARKNDGDFLEETGKDLEYFEKFSKLLDDHIKILGRQ